MWMLKLKTGLELTEKEMTCWDKVPKDIEIKAFALALHRPNQSHYIIEITGYEEICCARMAHAAVGGKTHITGYSLYCVKGDVVSEMRITGNGITLKSYSRDKLEVAPSGLRRMVE